MNYFRKKPYQLLLHEVLLRRAVVSEQVRSELESRYSILRAGYAGERRVDNEWREIDVQGSLLHDFTTCNAIGNTHQMDTIFICKHFVLVVEVKNVAGRIDFDDVRRQFVRTREDGTVEGFNNPVDQVKRHRDLLVEASIDWPFYVPVEAVVVIANPSTVIGRISNEIPIFNVSGLRTKIAELVKKHASVNVNVRAVRSLLEKMYEPIDRRVQFNYPIRKGVLCEVCNRTMVFDRGFICHHCNARDRGDVALRKALFDYRVLYGDRIRNQAFREFTGVQSARTASKMLNRVISSKAGKTKGIQYIIEPNIHERKK